MKPELQLINRQLAHCEKAIRQLKCSKKQTSTPDFKPDETKGEGKATEGELKYRADLLNLLKVVYDDNNKIINSDDGYDKKISKIEDRLNQFVTDAKKLINKTVNETWNKSIDNGLNILKKIDKKQSYPTKKISTYKLDLILLQQEKNIESIASKIKGNLTNLILIKAIQQDNIASKKTVQSIKAPATPNSTWTQCMRDLHKEEPDLTEQELRERCSYDSTFTDAQNNLETLGWFGWIQANGMALLSTMIMGAGVVGDLIADWFTCEEDPSMDRCDTGSPVCDDCLDMRDEYVGISILDSIWNLLGNMHPWCRCGMGNIRLASME
jgi:hypothetical protein